MGARKRPNMSGKHQLAGRAEQPSQRVELLALLCRGYSLLADARFKVGNNMPFCRLLHIIIELVITP